MAQDQPLKAVAIEAYAYRVPIADPLVVSFGIMRDRPCALVRVVDADGTEGWGEAWCNWPTPAAEHRARLISETIAEQFDAAIANGHVTVPQGPGLGVTPDRATLRRYQTWPRR